MTEIDPDRVITDADLIAQSADCLRRYEATGLTQWEHYNNALREGWDNMKFGMVWSHHAEREDAERAAAECGGKVVSRATHQTAHQPRW